MRTSKPLVPNSETSETLLDIPILITSSDVNQEDEEEDEAKEMEEIRASSLPSVMSLFIFLFLSLLYFLGVFL